MLLRAPARAQEADTDQPPGPVGRDRDQPAGAHLVDQRRRAGRDVGRGPPAAANPTGPPASATCCHSVTRATPNALSDATPPPGPTRSTVIAGGRVRPGAGPDAAGAARVAAGHKFGNQSPISRAADSGESEPCTRLNWVSRPKSPRMLPLAAFSTGSVPPASCRNAAIARGPSTTRRDQRAAGDEVQQAVVEALALRAPRSAPARRPARPP